MIDLIRLRRRYRWPSFRPTGRSGQKRVSSQQLILILTGKQPENPFKE
jgi:hypothetical protein